MSSDHYNRDVVTWRTAEVKVDRGDHWTWDYASPSFVLLCWGMTYRYLTKESNTFGSIFCACVFCSNFKWHLDWTAASTPLCLGPDQTLCDISRRFPQCTEYFLRYSNLRKQSGSAIFNPDFHLLVLASWRLHLRPALKQWHESWTQMGCGNTNTCVSCAITICHISLYSLFFTEPGVGLGIGACCLTLENSSPGIYIHSLAPGSVAKMDGRLRLVKAETCCSGFMIKSIEILFSPIGWCAGREFILKSSPKRKHLSKDIPK